MLHFLKIQEGECLSWRRLCNFAYILEDTQICPVRDIQITRKVEEKFCTKKKLIILNIKISKSHTNLGSLGKRVGVPQTNE